ncbi:MAG: hypothetical protein F2799_07310 [Actinobacteria bacterium]|uniref:Unannotated protein n=1 Tax=freshwater metagenome TaxID=449393 RepID=A0A6J7EE75_9ZZZZ|nr:hypothetical protein [Actinomycetota bacterium]
MTLRIGFKTVTALLTASLVVGLTACGGSSKSTTSTSKAKPTTAAQSRTITSGSITLAINPGTASKLKAAGVKVVPEGTGRTVASAAVLPAVGGRIVTKSLIGSVHTAASLTFAQGSKKVTFTNVALNTESRKITGSYKKTRVAIYQLRLKSLTRTVNKDGALVGSKISVVLSSSAASILNKALGVTVFRGKQPFGTATFRAMTKSKSSKKKSSSKKSSTKKKSSSTTTTTTSAK